MKFKAGVSIIIFALIFGLIWTAICITRITPGHIGIVYSPNGGIQNKALSPGWHKVGILDKVVDYPTRMQTKEYKDIQVATSDGKNISMDFAFTYHIQTDKAVDIFNKFGPVKVQEIEDGFLRTRLWDAARKSLSKYSVIDTYGEKSSDAALATQTRFSEDVLALGFVIENLTIGVPKPDSKTQDAIDARVTAAQELERKTIELNTALKEKEIKEAVAEGNARAAIIEATGRAEANDKLQMSITPELIEYEKIKKWDGVNPTTITGGSTSTLVQVK